MLAATLQGVTRTYGSGPAAVPALREITLEIACNCFTVLSGPSGSGKTTLLNLLGCLDQPDAGQVVVAGQAVQTWSDRALADFRVRHLGFIFQSFNLIGVLSAYENIEYPLTLLGLPRRTREARVNALLYATGLEQHGARRPGELSGGQRQRVAIARALVAEPSLVLADEPTANLDSATGQEILALMRRLQRQYATTFVFSSHDPHVLACADHVLYLRDGQIVADGMPHASVTRASHVTTLEVQS
ncbi:ABC transporter ATP-binding protein [Paraburkholderia bonniea]|uniref:ABC transporter ATP-binding protein n=1 Tax=Paraburkholderia bonniea TaxID=2152891 RepID=UPI00129168C5|nr:ABC transporter ATP-binding protein [Paraburkholderia bonniea]WJF91527.1 ABC transporter ATP-binding protein [Paraburkholderia bonniea]WJF94846.1 ABC transporter ATP-binding protein [Paraburkholderia bonniea]